MGGGATRRGQRDITQHKCGAIRSGVDGEDERGHRCAGAQAPGAKCELHSVPEPPLALAAVENMEDCELFNAGSGAVFNNKGFIENETSVMDRDTLRSGAVCECTSMPLLSFGSSHFAH